MIPIYKAERDAGITLNNSVTYASLVTTCEPFTVSDRVMASLRELSKKWAKAARIDEDLHFIRDIMVSSVWNNNDDVFDPVEMWIAKASPEHKPLNVGHIGTDIIGHIVHNEPIDDEGKVIAADIAMDDLPAKYHIATGSVIYKYWEDKKQEERVERLIAEIAEGKQFVSMECLFKGFDYAMKGPDGSCRVVARNEKTAYLSKCLRAYGGPGVYDGHRIGRVLRNILFSGKGLVEKPANPDSVIFTAASDIESFDIEKAERLQEFPRCSTKQVYDTSVNPPQRETSNIMAVDMTDLQKQVDALRAENEQLKIQAVAGKKEDAEKKMEELQKKHDEAKEAHAKTKKELDDAKEEFGKLKTDAEETKAKLAETEKTLAELKDELRQIHETRKQAERLTQIKAALKVDPANAEQVAIAEEMAANLVTLSDEAFSKYIGSQTKLTPAPLPPKIAAGQETPKISDKPAAGRTGEKEKFNTTHPDPTILAAAKVDADPALSVVPAGDGVKNVAADVAAYFGCTEE